MLPAGGVFETLVLIEPRVKCLWRQNLLFLGSDAGSWGASSDGSPQYFWGPALAVGQTSLKIIFFIIGRFIVGTWSSSNFFKLCVMWQLDVAIPFSGDLLKKLSCWQRLQIFLFLFSLQPLLHNTLGFAALFADWLPNNQNMVAHLLPPKTCVFKKKLGKLFAKHHLKLVWE